MVSHSSRYNPINGPMSAPLPRPSTDLNEPPIKQIKRPSHHGRLFWTEICWRLTATLIFSIVITIIIYSFSLKGILSLWEKRWFNVLAILFSSLVSLSTGSLLGLLGSMLRWPLLAHKLHTPTDVDLILGMPSPTGAIRLIWTHTAHRRKWCITTVVVILYLLVNIIGRLSVAAFGLTFDLNEQLGVEYPTRITNWNTSDWFDDPMLWGSRSPYFFVSNFDVMGSYAGLGLSSVPDDDFYPRNLSTHNLTNINRHGLDRMVVEDNVVYSYYLKEYHGGENVSSSTTDVLHSSSKCIGRSASISKHDQMVGDLSSNEKFMDFKQIVYFKQLIDRSYNYNERDIIWITPMDVFNLSEASPCARTYLYTASHNPDNPEVSDAALFECYTCTSHNNSIPGLGRIELSDSIKYNVSHTLQSVGSFQSSANGGDDKRYNTRAYPEMGTNAFASFLNFQMVSDEEYSDRMYSITPEANLYAAHLTARVPLLAVLGAEMRLPKVTRISGASERHFVDVRLRVELKKTIAVLLCIFGGQVLAIGVVLFYCRDVFIRDYASSLSVARLLKTTMENVEGMSIYTGDEITKYLESKGVLMRYGTRRRGDMISEVDLWNDVEDEFPDGVYK